jgi:hypothetical protein
LGSNPGRGNDGILYIATAPRPALGTTQPPTQRVQGILTLGMKVPGRGADQSPPYSVELVKHRDLISTLPDTRTKHSNNL